MREIDVGLPVRFGDSIAAEEYHGLDEMPDI